MTRPDLDRKIAQERAACAALGDEIRAILTRWRAIPEPPYRADVPNTSAVYANWRERRDLEAAAWSRAVLAGQQARFIAWLEAKRDGYSRLS